MDHRLELTDDTLDADERAALGSLADRLWDERAAIAGEWSRRLVTTLPEEFPQWVTLQQLTDVNAAFLATVLEPLRRNDLAGLSQVYYAMNRQLIEFALASSDQSFSLTSLYASARISLQVIGEHLGAQHPVLMVAYAKLAAHLMMVVGLAYSDCREATLGRSRDELERIVQERTAALREANAALQGEVAERKRVERACAARRRCRTPSSRRFQACSTSSTARSGWCAGITSSRKCRGIQPRRSPRATR